MDDLLIKLGLKKKKTARQKVQATATHALHTFGDLLDEVVEETRRKGPKQAKKAKKRLHEAQKQARHLAQEVHEQATSAAERATEQASDLKESLREAGASGRERAGEGATQLGEMSHAKVAAALAALGGLTANWDEVMSALDQELDKRATEREETETAKQKEKERELRKRAGRYPGLWLSLLRVGLGLWFLQRLRERDITAYIDHGAGETMRAQATNHPVTEYRALMETLLIPNASLVGLALVAFEGLAALGLLTGLNRRFAALMGLLVSGHDLMADYQNGEKRGQNLMLVLSELLLLRTGA